MAGSRSTRSPEIDALRGLAITLVVGSHVVLGCIESGALADDHPLALAYDWSHPFRVAAMVLVAGLFIHGALTKTTAWRYLASRGIVFGWLYLVWFVIQTGAELATNPWRNDPITSWTQVVDVWNPPAQLYFFPTLWVCTALVVLARGLAVLRDRPWLIVFAATALALATWGWAPPVIGLQFVSLVVFLALGNAVGLRRFTVFMAQPALVWIALGGAALVLYCSLQPTTLSGPNQYSALPLAGRLSDLVASCTGVVVICGAAVLIARTRVTLGVAAHLGVHSSAVFLAHIVVAAGTRIVLTALDTPVLVTVIVAWTLGILVPLALVHNAGRLRCRWLFEPPAALRLKRPLVTREAVPLGH